MKLTRWSSAAALAVALALPEAHAAPQLTMAWQPSATMAPGSTRRIRVTISNPDGLAYSGVSGVFTVPSGLTNGLVAPVSNGCAAFGATVNAPAGGGSLSFTSLFLGAGNACAFEVTMTATAAGTYPLEVGPGAFAASSPTFSSTGTVQAILTVIGTLVENKNAAGAGSLAAAITYANANCTLSPGPIVFQIPGPGPHTIAPATELPALTCPDIAIDAATQPGSILNSLASGNNADIQVILSGSSCGSCSNGLTLSADRILVRGFAIHSWAVNGIAINGNDAMIAGNYIGTDPGGMAAFPNGVAGIVISGLNANIGSGSTQDVNLITGNGQRQISVAGSGATVAYNQIGGNRTGAVSFISPATGIFGVSGSGANIVGNLIMGNLQYGIYMDGPTFSATIEANAVSFNSSGGIRLGGSSHLARQNLVAYMTGYGMVVTDNNMQVTENQVHDNSQDGIISDGASHDFIDNMIYSNAGPGLNFVIGNAQFVRNLVYLNGGPGIVLGPGANGNLGAPAVTSVQRSGGTTFIMGTVNAGASHAGEFGVVDLFGNPNNPPTPSGELFLTSVPVTLDAAGATTFSTSVAGLPDWVTATLTLDECFDGCLVSSALSNPAVQSVLVAGAALTASPASYSFPDQAVGTVSPPTTITLTNSGPGGVNISSTSSNGDFSYTSDCGPFLAVGATCTFIVEFRPIIGGMRSGGIFVYSDAAATTFVIPLSGNGLGGGRAAISVEPTALEFGAVTVFESASTKQRTRVSNTGSGVLEFSFGTTSEEFPIIRGSMVTSEVMPVSGDATTCTGTLAVGAFCEIVIGFSPQAPGARSALLIIESNAEFAAPNVRLAGFGTAPGFVAPVTRPLAIEPALRFGDQVIATQSTGLVLKVTNTTTGRITFAEFSISSGDFTLGAGCTMVEPGATCERSVFFRPSALGGRFARITIRSSTETTPYLVEVTGAGIPNPVPQLAVSPEGIGFGPVVGISTGVVTLTNTGQLPVVITNVAGLGGFQARSACGEILAVGAQCLVEITFVSSVPGFREGELRVESNAARSPHRVSLSATACRPLAGGGRLRRDPCK